MVWRRLWRGSVFSYVFAPLLFLAAMGIGLGDLVDEHQGGVQGFDYLEFITPGLHGRERGDAGGGRVAVAGDGRREVAAAPTTRRSSTPISSSDVYLGQLSWTGVRTVMSATVFLAVAAVLGGVPSFWGVLAIPAAVLGALAIAAPLSAWAIERESDAAFAVVMRIVVFPLFLFSGTFFPISRLPDWLEPVALLSPLYHAVELCRWRRPFGVVGRWAAVVGHRRWCCSLFIAWGVWWGQRTLHPDADAMTAGTDVDVELMPPRSRPGLVDAEAHARWRSGAARWRVVERNTTAYRRQWYLFLTGLIEPALYLLSIGIGVGGLVGKVPGPGGEPSTTRRSSRPG